MLNIKILYLLRESFSLGIMEPKVTQRLAILPSEKSFFAATSFNWPDYHLY